MVPDRNTEDFDTFISLGGELVRVNGSDREVRVSVDLEGLTTAAATLVAFVTAASVGLIDVRVDFDVDCDIGFYDGDGGESYDTHSVSSVTVVVSGLRPLTPKEATSVAAHIAGWRADGLTPDAAMKATEAALSDLYEETPNA